MDLNPASNRALLYFLLAAGGLWLLYLLSPILSPFLFAAALAYLCDPLVDRLERRRVSRTLATVAVLLGLLSAFILFALVFAPLVSAETRLLLDQIPRAVEWTQATLLPWLETRLGLDVQRDQEEIMVWLRSHAGELAGLTAYLPALGGQGLALLGWLANLLLVPLVTFYLLRDWDRTMAGLAGLLPASIRPQALHLAREVDTVLAEFVRGQVLVMVVMAVFYSLGLWLVGLEYALAVGVIAGILVFVPYLGVIVGVLLGTLAGLGQHGELLPLVPVWLVFAAGQLLEGMVITPRLVGERVGLHPVAVIFALMAFGQLFGFFGVLLAIPASAALLVGLRHLRAHLHQEGPHYEP
jgi:predicted PurR-regulated permease PerM